MLSAWFNKLHLYAMAWCGSGSYQAELGRRLYVLAELEPQKRRAASWLRKAAEGGQSDAQLLLAQLYIEGFGVDQNEDAALHWYRIAALKGNPEAEHAMGWCFEQGIGGRQDDCEAARWWQKSANKGIAESQYGLASLYHEGRGVNKNIDNAFAWYSFAEENGIHLASTKLRQLTEEMSAIERARAEKHLAELRKSSSPRAKVTGEGNPGSGSECE